MEIALRWESMETSQQEFQQGNAPVPSGVKNFPYDERLSSWEMSELWVIYQGNSSMKCILQYFVATAQDPEIKALLNDFLNIILSNLNTMTNLFNSVGFPIPNGFNDEDVELNTKRLYSDSLMLAYLRTINKFGLIKLAFALPLASRPDVRDYLTNAVVEALNLLNKTEDLIAKKGIAVKPPYTPVPDSVNFVNGKNYIGGLLSKNRPLNVLECTQVFVRIETKISVRAILLGFAQVAKTKEVKAYLSKGDIFLGKEIEKMSSILIDEDLATPRLWSSEVTDSTESPFSDKLMLFIIVSSLSFAFGANGFALGNCIRTDLVARFSKALLDLGVYGKEGLELLIEKGWMEEIPPVADREKIIGLH